MTCEAKIPCQYDRGGGSKWQAMGACMPKWQPPPHTIAYLEISETLRIKMPGPGWCNQMADFLTKLENLTSLPLYNP